MMPSRKRFPRSIIATRRVAPVQGVNTTTELLTRYVFDRIAEAARSGKLGWDGPELSALRVTIAESFLARASRGAIVVSEAVVAVRRPCDSDRRLWL
jgi:hypothetical protein